MLESIFLALWTSWKRWTECSETCGDGYRTDIRHCQLNISSKVVPYSFCPGLAIKEEDCLGADCRELTLEYRVLG